MVCNTCQQKAGYTMEYAHDPNQYVPPTGYDPACQQCSSNYRADTRRTFGQSILGRNIIGRSTAGYDVRGGPDGMYGYYTRGGPHRGKVLYNGAESVQTRMGDNHQYPQQTGMPTKKLEEGFPWGIFVVGGVLGFVFAAFVLTPTGRGVGAATGKRAAKKIRG